MAEVLNDIAEMYQKGIDDYWGGVVPSGWDDTDANDNPYLAGWNHSAQQDNGIGFFSGESDWSGMEDDDDDDS